jgi:hypothetical protein
MKRAALVAILASVAVAAAIGSPVWALAAQVVVLSGTTAFILTRPDGPN